MATATRAQQGQPATAAQPVEPQHYELLDFSDQRGHGQRVHRFRWHVDEHQGDDTLIERIVPVSRQLIEDRWDSMFAERPGGFPKTQERLDGLLHDIAERLTRRDVGAPDYVLVDGEVSSVDSELELDSLQGVIREWFIERASKPGVSL
jgi:hypothetical protein